MPDPDNGLRRRLIYEEDKIQPYRALQRRYRHNQQDIFELNSYKVTNQLFGFCTNVRQSHILHNIEFPCYRPL